MLLNDQRVIEGIQKKIKNLLKINENENTTYQNLRDTTKAALGGKFITLSGYI